MPDRETVIKRLHKLVTYFRSMRTVGYHGDDEVYREHLETAMMTLELLKEQEAVEPLAKEDDSYECICGAIVGWDELDASGIVQTRFNYCPFCGKPISWEGR